MRKISNNPSQIANGLNTRVYWYNFFDNSEIDQIVKYCESFELQNSTISQKNPNVNKSIRISKTNFHSRNDNNSWIFDRINYGIEEVNNNFFNFDLYGYEYFQYSHYNAVDSGKYDFHMDTFINEESLKLPLTRKLSLVLLLSDPKVDFEGGEFQINTSAESRSETIEMHKGTLIAFPSFIIHRVKPITKGTRKSIVVWVDGPKFK